MIPGEIEPMRGETTDGYEMVNCRLGQSIRKARVSFIAALSVN